MFWIVDGSISEFARLISQDQLLRKVQLVPPDPNDTFESDTILRSIFRILMGYFLRPSLRRSISNEILRISIEGRTSIARVADSWDIGIHCILGSEGIHHITPGFVVVRTQVGQLFSNVIITINHMLSGNSSARHGNIDLIALLAVPCTSGMDRSDFSWT